MLFKGLNNGGALTLISWFFAPLLLLLSWLPGHPPQVVSERGTALVELKEISEDSLFSLYGEPVLELETQYKKAKPAKRYRRFMTHAVPKGTPVKYVFWFVEGDQYVAVMFLKRDAEWRSFAAYRFPKNNF